MLTRECTLYAFVLDYFRKLTIDIPDEQLTAQPRPEVNHAAWIIGHLAIANDYAAKLLGATGVCSEEWFKLFGPGSQLQANRNAYPSKAELVAQFEAGHEVVLAAAKNVTDERLDKPQMGPFYKEQLPTIGDITAHLMTTHACAHLGQLSIWRRIHGLPSALGI